MSGENNTNERFDMLKESLCKIASKNYKDLAEASMEADENTAKYDKATIRFKLPYVTTINADLRPLLLLSAELSDGISFIKDESGDELSVSFTVMKQ